MWAILKKQLDSTVLLQMCLTESWTKDGTLSLWYEAQKKIKDSGLLFSFLENSNFVKNTDVLEIRRSHFL